MLSKKIENALNHQIKLEADSSQFYLAMASWAEHNGLNGAASFLYRHSDEERMHMLKLVHYVNERGGKAIIPSIQQPPTSFQSLSHIFESLLKHEINVTKEINKVVGACLEDKDYTTHHFMQWYVAEQIEEEALARTIMDKLKLIGNDKGGLYLFDRDIQTLANAPVPSPKTA
ncbi:MAG: ferritin [Bacteroidetes bacterium]|nr:ferritin [Bacteroidota bacterium]MBV6461077.1 putative bacterial non-heme ferritin [Flavobacteriales bacterium]WKZ75526.1 MAG: ferritin [Vicingaceae bacterium]MCL4815092.1 ferritin [Flavobacteriales bacterium]NOG94801.1 ferritin [Bacteroidota bacterium]